MVTSDSEKRTQGSSMATALADFKECLLVSSAVEGHTDADRSLPRLFDLVGKLNSTTGTLVELAVCVGVAFKAGAAGVEKEDLIIMGTPISMFSEGGFGEKGLELSLAKVLTTTQRRYLPASYNDPVISVKMLSVDGEGLVMRRFTSLLELTAAAGGKLVEQLKTFMLSWHMLDGLRTAKILSSERDGVLADMVKLMQPVPPSRAVSAAGQALLEQGAASMARTVLCENARAARTETAQTLAVREARFYAACEKLGKLLDTSPMLFGCSSRLDVAVKQAVLTKLRRLKPPMQTRTEKRLQDEAHGALAAGARNPAELAVAAAAAAAAAKKAGGPANRRGPKRGPEHGNSPAGPKARTDAAADADVDVDVDADEDPSSAAIRKRAADIAHAFGSGSDSGSLTSLAAHNQISAEAQVLRRERDALTSQLESVQRLLASETEAHALTKAELKGMQISVMPTGPKPVMQQLSEAKADIARLKEKVKQQKQTIKKAEGMAAHNQAMFLAKLDMDAEKINKFMPTAMADDSDED